MAEKSPRVHPTRHRSVLTEARFHVGLELQNEVVEMVGAGAVLVFAQDFWQGLRVAVAKGERHDIDGDCRVGATAMAAVSLESRGNRDGRKAREFISDESEKQLHRVNMCRLSQFIVTMRTEVLAFRTIDVSRQILELPNRRLPLELVEGT